MKNNWFTCSVLAGLWVFSSSLSALRAQGTAFTYQGRLNEAGGPANGNYDFSFALYDAPNGGTLQGGTLTNTSTPVSNGVFTVTLDFGNQFSGTDRWLELGVRPIGSGVFSLLAPRQQLTAVPYAVTASNVTGMVAAGQLSGTLAVGAVTNASGSRLAFLSDTNGLGGTPDPSIFYPETYGAVGAARTNDDSAAWQATWYAAAGLSNSMAILDGRGRSYNIQTTVQSLYWTSRPATRSYTIRNAVFLTTNITAGFTIWSNNADYVTFDHCYFGCPTNANVANIAFAAGSPNPLANAYPERLQFHDCVITNFAIAVLLSQQDNPVIEGGRFFGCRSNYIILDHCDQWNIKSTYWGFGAEPGHWGDNFYSGVGVRGWDANAVGIYGIGGIGGTISDGCAQNWTRQALYWIGGAQVSILGENDFEGIHAPPGSAVIKAEYGVALHVQGLKTCCSSNGLVMFELNSCYLNGCWFENPPDADWATFSITSHTDTNPYVIPRISGGNPNGVTVVYHTLYGDGGVTNILLGGNVPTTTAQNRWIGPQTFDSRTYLRSGGYTAMDLVLGADTGTNGPPIGSGDTIFGASGVMGNGGNNALFGYQDQSAGNFNLLFGQTPAAYRASPTEMDFYTTATYGTAGIPRLKISKAGITFYGTNGQFAGYVGTNGFAGNGSDLTNLNVSGSQITGPVPLARLPAALVTNGASGLTLSGTLTGDGGGMTNLSGGNLASGTVADARLTANVALLNRASQWFTGGTNCFSGSVGIGTANPGASLQVFNSGSRVGVFVGNRSPSAAAAFETDFSGGATHASFQENGTNVFQVTAGGNVVAAGTITGASDRNGKEHFHSINPRTVLEKVSALPITEWNYRNDAPNLRHIGPMAQDFYAAFAVGLDDKHISMVDADGVALAAIQGLNEKTEDRSQRAEARIQNLEAENAELKARLEKLEQMLAHNLNRATR